MPIRQRIAFSTAGVMILLLLGLSLGIYTAMSRNLNNEVDSRLQTVYNTYRQNPAAVSQRPDGQFTVDLPDLDPFTSPGLFMQVVNQRGEVNDQSATLAGQPLPIPEGVLEENAARSATFYNARIDEVEIRVYSAPVFLQGVPEAVAFVQVAESLEPLNETLDQLRVILLFGSLLATLVVSTVAWFLAGAAMRPIARMSATAQAIGGANDLSQRLDSPTSGDEVEQLAQTFNAMLDRLDDSFRAQRRFVADASHELRTPLTALRGNTEILRRMVASGKVDQETLIEGLGDIGGEVDRMTRLVQDLLTLARADVGWKPEMSPVHLVHVARDAARTFAPLTRRHRFEMQVPPEPGPVVLGSADQLTQLVIILLDNAVTHTPPGTEVRLSVDHDGDDAVLTVFDNGPGISREHQARLFERFYRPDSSRSRSAGGTGLGLAIAAWIVSIHGATFDIQSGQGHGTQFSIRIPVIDLQADHDTERTDAAS
jgi:two-component system, OmpR family, sensor kinase